jgi:hypothetical protein
MREQGAPADPSNSHRHLFRCKSMEATQMRVGWSIQQASIAPAIKLHMRRRICRGPALQESDTTISWGIEELGVGKTISISHPSAELLVWNNLRHRLATADGVLP